MQNPPVSGKDLRLMRVAADVTATDLARAMGIGVSGVSALEARRKVTEKARVRYVTALATFATSDGTTGQDAA